jgi:hypothetical protein
MATAESWDQVIAKEWRMLREASAEVSVEKFFRHAVTAYQVRMLNTQDVARIAVEMFGSPLEGAPYLGRKLLEKVGPRSHPPVGAAYALALLHGYGGPADIASANTLLDYLCSIDDVTKDTRGLALAMLADSYRLARGYDANPQKALKLYEQALENGFAAYLNLGLYWEGKWTAHDPAHKVPDKQKAIGYYRRGSVSSPKCAARLAALQAGKAGAPMAELVSA